LEELHGTHRDGDEFEEEVEISAMRKLWKCFRNNWHLGDRSAEELTKNHIELVGWRAMGYWDNADWGTSEWARMAVDDEADEWCIFENWHSVRASFHYRVFYLRYV
jgi:hypothetical protein